jgi:hypothetical protein
LRKLPHPEFWPLQILKNPNMLSDGSGGIPDRPEQSPMHIMGSMTEIESGGIESCPDQCFNFFTGVAGGTQRTDNLNFSSR